MIGNLYSNYFLCFIPSPLPVKPFSFSGPQETTEVRGRGDEEEDGRLNVCFNLYSLSVCCYHHNVENKNSIRFNAIQWDICLKNHWSWESMLIFTMILVWYWSKTFFIVHLNLNFSLSFFFPNKIMGI